MLTEEADKVVVVVLADEGLGDDWIQRFNAIVPDGLATLSGSDGTRFSVTTLFLVRLCCVRAFAHAFEVLFDHCSLLAGDAKGFPQEPF